MLCLLWLLVLFAGFGVLSDPDLRWDWQLAGIIPLLLVATFVSVLLWIWARPRD